MHPSLGIENIKVAYHGVANPIGKGSATVSYTVRNTGNVRLGGDETVRVSGLFGSKSKLVTAPKIDLLFPRATQKVSVEVSGVLPTIFDRAKVTVSPLLFSDQPPMPVPTATASKSFYAIPWTLLGILVGLIVLGGLGLLLRRARRRKPRPGPGPGRHGSRRGGPSGPQDPSSGMPRPVIERVGS